MNKKETRTFLKIQWKDADPIRIKKSSGQICRNILSSDAWKESSGILAYLSFENEVSLDELISTSLDAGKNVYAPRIQGINMGFHRITHMTPGEFEINRWGIREPKADSPLLTDDPRSCLILVPGLGFTADGKRMGRGGGYYDRFLGTTGSTMTKMGITMEKVILNDLPTEDHDQIMDWLCSEERLIRIKS